MRPRCARTAPAIVAGERALARPVRAENRERPAWVRPRETTPNNARASPYATSRCSTSRSGTSSGGHARRLMSMFRGTRPGRPRSRGSRRECRRRSAFRSRARSRGRRGPAPSRRCARRARARCRARRAAGGSTSTNASVSRTSRPDDGSSSSTTFGSVASARPISTRRPVPSGSVAAGAEASRVSPSCARIASTASSSPGTAAGRPERVEQESQRDVAATAAVRDHQVFAHRELGEQLEPLEGPGEPAPGPSLRRRARDVDAVDRDGSRPRPEKARQDSEARRLAGAVRTDAGRRSMRSGTDTRHLVERDQSAEAHGDVAWPRGARVIERHFRSGADRTRAVRRDRVSRAALVVAGRRCRSRAAVHDLVDDAARLARRPIAPSPKSTVGSSSHAPTEVLAHELREHREGQAGEQRAGDRAHAPRDDDREPHDADEHRELLRRRPSRCRSRTARRRGRRRTR